MHGQPDRRFKARSGHVHGYPQRIELVIAKRNTKEKSSPEDRSEIGAFLYYLTTVLPSAGGFE